MPLGTGSFIALFLAAVVTSIGAGNNLNVFPQTITLPMTARLCKATNTPGFSETLSDIAAGCDRTERIVYPIPGMGAFDVYGFTFQLSDSINDQLNNLISLVWSFNLHDGTEASLITKSQDTLAAIACDSANQHKGESK